MVTAVSIRGGMEDSDLQSHIAYSAGESKSPPVMTGAGAVVQILKLAGLVKEQDGKLVAEPIDIARRLVRSTSRNYKRAGKGWNITNGRRPHCACAAGYESRSRYFHSNSDSVHGWRNI